jgi:hypothetical protein
MVWEKKLLGKWYVSVENIFKKTIFARWIQRRMAIDLNIFSLNNIKWLSAFKSKKRGKAGHRNLDPALK